MSTVASCLAWAEQVLAIDARTDSYWLLAHVVGKNLAWLRAQDDYVLSDQQLKSFQQCVERRRLGEPVAYITGYQGFWSLDLQVTPATLVPRPDTELLVEKALVFGSLKANCNLVDLGTGSGAVAIAIGSERPKWQITATDQSVDALSIAKVNAANCGVAVTFVQGSWLSCLDDCLFDMVVSNPPYIEVSDPHLQQLHFEPLSALTSGVDGLDDIRVICDTAPRHLNQRGWLLLEHGYNQGAAVRQLFTQRGFDDVTTFLDLAGHERVTAGQWNGGGQ